jgi:hypothetical protein
MSQDIKKKLKPEWELFCQYFVSSYETFGNATRSYAKAYNIDISDKSKYHSCRTQGYRLLAIESVLKRINELLTDLVMNDTTVDMQLAFLITQMTDYGAKVQAIREYNKLKQRIIDKHELKVDPIETILKKFGLRGEDVGQVEGVEESSSQDNS